MGVAMGKKNKHALQQKWDILSDGAKPRLSSDVPETNASKFCIRILSRICLKSVFVFSP